jgi:hypothetical protein
LAPAIALFTVSFFRFVRPSAELGFICACFFPVPLPVPPSGFLRLPLPSSQFIGEDSFWHSRRGHFLLHRLATLGTFFKKTTFIIHQPLAKYTNIYFITVFYKPDLYELLAETGATAPSPLPHHLPMELHE